MSEAHSLLTPDSLAILAMAYLLTTLAIATVTDVVSHRIPNALLLPSLAIALLLGAVADGFGGLVTVGAGLCVGLAMLLPLYIVGGTAAGDVKLLAVAGAYLGPVGAFLAGMFTFMAGAVFGLVWIAWRTARQSRPHSAADTACVAGDGFADPASSRAAATKPSDAESQISGPLAGAANAFAYAPAISAGCLAAAWYQGWSFFGA